MKKLFFILLITLVLGGCVSHPLTPENRAQIKTVKVLPVKWEKNMVYFGQQQAWGAALGAGLGAGVGMASGASKV
ncbi:starvation-inducible outer membrane lipoprotein [Pseudomonas cedrina]|nr:starvation-inducible outer membrane lipoprotein [Pseudomonas cedrina]